MFDGLMVLLNMAGNTIAQQAQRIEELTARVAELEAMPAAAGESWVGPHTITSHDGDVVA